MGKRLEITPKIAAAIERSTGGTVDPNSVAVFETIALNTLPLSKKGSLYEKAVASSTLLMEMAAFVSEGENFVPLHTNHDQGWGGMPIGRVFDGEAIQTSLGTTDLRVLFYISLTESDLIQKVENGSIDEVSVGVSPKHITCSECGFDYMGQDATFDNIWDRTCENGHTVGTDGVHVNFTGLDRFLELSLVSLGAARGAKIQSRMKSLLGNEGYAHQLAATGIAPELKALFASPTKKEPPMELTALIAELTTAKASVQVIEAAQKADKETIATLTKTNDELTKKVTEMEASLNASTLPAVQKELGEVKASMAEATQVMRKEADRLCVAAGLELAAEDATIAALSEKITSTRAKLATMIPVGGKSQPANTGSGENLELSLVAASFKTRK